MQAVLAHGAKFHFRARGLSMSPFIKDGDSITIAPLTHEQPGIGKVVAFIHPGTQQLVVHRVIGREGSAFWIQGDNAAGQPDGLVDADAILGCVTNVERDGRLVMLGLGPERYLVAFLSRRGWLAGVVNRLRALKP
jgi:phage repressor protein C with HTH and peptisase S24 domain